MFYERGSVRSLRVERVESSVAIFADLIQKANGLTLQVHSSCCVCSKDVSVGWKILTDDYELVAIVCDACATNGEEAASIAVAHRVRNEVI